MKNGKTKKIKSDDIETGVIINAIESAQEQINKISFSFPEIKIDTTKIYQPYIDVLTKISTTFPSDYLQNIYKVIQKQLEFFKAYNEKFLYINITQDHKIAIPAKIDKKKEIGKLKNEINLLKKEIEIYKSKENSSLLEINSFGNFIYKEKFLKISADSNSGKFFKKILEDKNHFISDKYCQSEFNCPTTKEITYIIRDLNKILSKDNLKVKLRRCRDAKGYILEGITETKS